MEAKVFEYIRTDYETQHIRYLRSAFHSPPSITDSIACTMANGWRV